MEREILTLLYKTRLIRTGGRICGRAVAFVVHQTAQPGAAQPVDLFDPGPVGRDMREAFGVLVFQVTVRESSSSQLGFPAYSNALIR